MTPAADAAGCHRAPAAGKRCGDRRKMTLVAYERYFNAEDDYTREARYRNISRRCVTISVCWDARLSTAAGAANPGLRADVYSREPAFLLALDRQPELITEALKTISCWLARLRCWWRCALSPPVAL